MVVAVKLRGESEHVTYYDDEGFSFSDNNMSLSVSKEELEEFKIQEYIANKDW